MVGMWGARATTMKRKCIFVNVLFTITSLYIKGICVWSVVVVLLVFFPSFSSSPQHHRPHHLLYFVVWITYIMCTTVTIYDRRTYANHHANTTKTTKTTTLSKVDILFFAEKLTFLIWISRCRDTVSVSCAWTHWTHIHARARRLIRFQYYCRYYYCIRGWTTNVAFFCFSFFHRQPNRIRSVQI